MTDKPEGEATLFLALESICDAFESALQTDSSPRIEDYLAKVGSHQQERLLRELCLIEIQHRIDRKEEVSLAEYAQRFPAHPKCLENLAQEHPRWDTQSNPPANPPNPDETLVTGSDPKFTSSSNWHALETMAAVGDSTDPENPPSCRFGDYELIEKIGQGGMGVIYKARQQKLNRVVAVKMIRAGKLASPSDIQRFQSEAEAIGRLEHPQIVPIYEVDQVEGIHFFSMAFIDGEDLAQKLRQGPLPQRQAAQLVGEIALAIHYAHQQGIIHRDLKPANILLTRDGQIRVTDFGLAKLQDAEHGQTVTGDVVGTPGYMSPEQAAGQRASVGTASDIYSLGAILYSLLTGRPPFQAATMVDTLLQVINDSPISPRQVNPAIDRDLETICLKCLEKTASRRYPTAQDLSDELQRFINGHPIEARPVGVLSRVWRWSCRRPKLAAAWSTVAALLLFLSIAGPLAAIHQAQLKTAADQSAQDSLQSAAKYRKEQIRANAKATEAEHALYDTRMILAQSALENNNPGYTRQLLALYEGPSTGNDYRGFEWHYLNQQVHQEICSINPHPGFAIMDVATPPSREVRGIDLRNESPVFDIFEFATLGGDGFLRIWQIDGTMKREVSLGPSGGYCMDYKNDGQLIVVGSKSGEIRFFDVKTLEQKKQVKVGLDDIFDIDLCPPNDWGEMCIVRNNKGAILSLNLETDDVKMIAPALTLRDGRPLQEDYWNPRRRFACEVSGKHLAFNLSHNIAIWDLEQGILKHTVKGTETRNSIPQTSNHRAESSRTTLRPPTAIEKGEFSNGGELIRLAPALHLTSKSKPTLVLGNRIGEITVWSASDNISADRYHDHTGAIDHVLMTWHRLFGNMTVSSGRDGTIRVHRPYNGTRVLRGHETRVCCFALHRSNNLVISADRAGKLKIFPLWDNPRQYRSGKLAFHPLETSFALTGDKVAVGASPSTDVSSKMAIGIETANDQGKRNFFLCTRIGHKTTRNARKLTTLSRLTPTGRAIDFHSGVEDWEPELNDAECLTFHPQGNQLAAGLNDGTIYIWNPGTGESLRAWKAHESSIQSLAHAPNGTRLASISFDNQLKIWDSNTGELVQQMPYPFMIGSRLSWNDDGTRIVAGTLNGRSTVIDVASGKTVLVLPGGSGIYTPDGKQILYVEVPDSKRTNGKHIIACDALTGKEKRRFKGHKNRVSDLVVTADNQRLISLDKGKGIAIWNMNTGTKIMNLHPSYDGARNLGADDIKSHKVHISPDGRSLAYQGNNGTTVWSSGKITKPSQAEEGP